MADPTRKKISEMENKAKIIGRKLKHLWAKFADQKERVRERNISVKLFSQTKKFYCIFSI